MNPARKITGMATGAILMTMFACLWLVWASQVLGTKNSWVMIAISALTLASLLLALRAFRVGRQAKSQTVSPSPEQERESRRMGRIFGIVFAAEGVLILVAVNVLNNLHLQHDITAAIAAIVGLHFLPLAHLFRFKPYYFVGAVMTLAAISSLALAYPLGAGLLAAFMGTVLWLTCIFVAFRAIALGRSWAGLTQQQAAR